MGADLELLSGLCTIQLCHPSSGPAVLEVEVPTRTYIYNPGHMSSRHVVEEPWIIPDGQVDDEKRDLHNLSLRLSKHAGARGEATDQRLTINFNAIYEQAFLTNGQTNAVDLEESMDEILDTVLHWIRQGRQDDDALAIRTLLDLSQTTGFAEDLEQGAPILRTFLQSLKEDEESESSFTLVVSNLTLCPGISFQTLEASTLPDLLKVYDEVAKSWVANLPHQVSGLTRLAKFKIARKVAVELCLSSIGISLRNKASEVPEALAASSEQRVLLNKPVVASRASSPAIISSENPPSSMPGSVFGLPTPSQTPSIYSQSHASTSEFAEDSAISRLRQYAVSIKSKPDIGSSTILSHWPSTPGADPATFSYAAKQRSAVVKESGEGDSHSSRREQARSKRRTERFLSRESTAVAEPSSSQPTSMPFGGSQPEVARHVYSSQTGVDDVPMTQPDRGTFGSRTMQKKKRKKQRAAGFK